MKMWLPQGNTESDQEIRAAAYDFMRHREQQAKAKSHGVSLHLSYYPWSDQLIKKILQVALLLPFSLLQKAKATATTTTAPATAGNQLPEKNRHV